MALDLSLAPDLDRGGHLYRAELAGELDAAAVHELSEWLGDAKQNPDARFVIDLSGMSGSGRRARLELRALMRRHADLHERRRLSVVYPSRRSRSRSGSRAAAPLGSALPALLR